MDRKMIFDLLNPLYPTYSIGQNQGNFNKPYIVVKYDNQQMSGNNDIAGWQYVEVMCYTPCNDEQNSILPIDIMTDSVLNALKNVLEFTGNITPDYFDTDRKCNMRSVEFRIPKEVI